MDILKNPPSGSSRDSLPIIHRRRISDEKLEQIVLDQIKQQSDFTLFTHLPSPHHSTGRRNHSYREVLEHDENRRVLQSRPEFSGETFDRFVGKTFKVSYSSTEVKVLSTGKPISEFVPYYVWHEDSGVHCHNLTTGETTTGKNVTVALNNFAHPHSLIRVRNDPNVLIRQVDKAFGIASGKIEGHFLEINSSLLASFELKHSHRSVVEAGGIEYFEELVLPITLQKKIPVTVFKKPSAYMHIDRNPIPESRYIATIKYLGGVRTDNIMGKVIGTECTVMEVLSVTKDQNYEVQQQTQFRNFIRNWVLGSIAGLILTTGGVLGFLSSDSWAVIHTQNILKKGRSLGDPSYYRNQAGKEAADASPERKSLIATVIADDLVSQENDAQARSYYSRAVSLDPNNIYARYGLLITDVIAGISCKKTVREEKVNSLFSRQDKIVPYYTCAWKDENNRTLQHSHAERLLADLRRAGNDESLEHAIIAARDLSASSVPILDQKQAWIFRSVLYNNSTGYNVPRKFDGGGAP